MWGTFYGHSAYIQITFVTCQDLGLFHLKSSGWDGLEKIPDTPYTF